MDKDLMKAIFITIKRDDVYSFSRLIKDNVNLSFGRFPILSLCYLYNAKNIIKKFKKRFYKISEYKKVDEYVEIYKVFKPVAGRALRLYTNGALVTPLEMLAILGKDHFVKKEYNKFYRDKKIERSLEKIYLIHGQNVSLYMYKIKIERKTLTCYQKRPYKLALIMCLAFIVFVSGGYALCNFTNGLGTSWSISKISSGSQFVSAMKLNGKYELTKDISIDKSFSLTDFDGEIDGNNHTIYVNCYQPKGLIKTNTGSIKNLNIVYKNIDASISSNLSLLVHENHGVIQNVNILCQEIKLNCQKIENKDLYITGIAVKNNKTIENCNVELTSVNLTGSLSGNCSFAGICGENFGYVVNSNLKDGDIVLNEVDGSGIVAINNKKGVVKNCRSYSTILQTSIEDGWSPNVSGIVLTNNGTIEECVNYGNLEIISNNDNEGSGGAVFLGGISAMNYGLVNKCLNYGNLDVQSKMIIVYCGGITSYSTYIEEENIYYVPVIYNCGNESTITVINENEEGFTFVGGISGYLYGDITNNFSITQFTHGYDEKKDFVGNCVGAGYLEYQLLGSIIRIIATNNFTLSQDNVEFQIGSLINQNTIVSAGINDNGVGIVTFATAEDIQKQEVYYSEQ